MNSFPVTCVYINYPFGAAPKWEKFHFSFLSSAPLLQSIFSFLISASFYLSLPPPASLLVLIIKFHSLGSFWPSLTQMTEVPPDPRRWTLRFGGLVEAVNGAHVDPSGRTDLLKVLDRAKRDGNLPLDEGETALLECDCDVVKMSAKTTDDCSELLALVPLHQISSVGFVHEPPQNILALKVGDVEEDKPDQFDLIILYTPTEEMADQICQHLAFCFQFIYREALSNLEQNQHDHQQKDDLKKTSQQRDISAKFASAVPSSATSSSLCSLSLSHHNQSSAPLQHIVPSVNNANSTSTSSSSTKNAVELINEYLTMLSACLSHDELNKFAILMRRWRACEMPILEFAQKLLELYGPERRHLLARMRTLLRGDPSELEALTDFLRANGVVENAAARASSPLLTAEMSLGEEANSAKSMTSSLPSAPLHLHHPFSDILPSAVLQRPNSS